MGLVAFAAFVLPWAALALWLHLTQIKPYHTGVPWRPLTDYVAPGDAPRHERAGITPASGQGPLADAGGAGHR